jgi:hypothetical protein
MKNTITLFFIFIFMAFLLNGEDKKSRNHSVAELSWLSGKWIGKEWGGDIEEYWSEPFGKTMVGVFRLVINDSTKVLELLTIEETADDLIFRFKHFDHTLKSWEDEALIFNFKEMDNRRIVFESDVQNNPKRMTYHEVAPDSLVVTVESEVEGEVKSFQTRKKRVR